MKDMIGYCGLDCEIRKRSMRNMRNEEDKTWRYL